MNLLNNWGPRIDPCGTPRSILHHSLNYLYLPIEIVPTNSFEQVLSY